MMNTDTGGLTSASARGRLVERIARKLKVRPEVLDAMEYVPRHQFVDPGLASRAYDDTVLPIGFGQTISQPTVVAMMSTAAIESVGRSRALEIGTGCGYQTAILAMLFDHVYSVERIRPLQFKARQTLDELSIKNVSMQHADGHIGWEEFAPFDVVVCTAAFKDLPEGLKQQVSSDGRILYPIDRRGEDFQDLTQLDRVDSRWEKSVLATVRFVPMLEGTQE